MLNVPLFAGFMYAAVGSFIARIWRLFYFGFTRHPPLPAIGLLSIAIYANFFAHHYMADMRYLLFVAAGLLFGRTWLYFKVWRVHRRMPLLLACFLTAFFLWVAENIGTMTKVWLYPHQLAGWSPVSIAKLGSWFLTLIISYTLVAIIHKPQEIGRGAGRPRRPAVLVLREGLEARNAG